jgi:hypothetical protein
MLLISIHPFAFRRLALLVLAIVGFSAICFADPVLMAHRYTRSQSTRTVVPPTLASGDLSGPAWSSTASLDITGTPRLPLSGARPCERRIDALDAIPREGFFLMAAD